MNEMVSHIEFLLHEHNCVIIPDFGGFVVNMMPSRRDGVATFLAPTCELVFNRDLTHNDGLLAQSYMKRDQLTFEAAMQRVERAVEELKSQLREMHRVEMGKLGSFVMSDENRFTFMPAHFVRPALFGLNRATLRPLVQMQSPAAPVKEVASGRRQRYAGVAAVAAAMILLMMFLLPVSDTNKGRQSAQMIADTSLFGNKASKLHTQEIAQPDIQVANAADSSPALPTAETATAEVSVEVPAETPTQMLAAAGPHYYVVMGVYELPHVAQKMIETLQNEGFAEVGSLKRSGRIDVYAASFTNGAEAQAFLQKIYENYPTHSDAWILKSR